LTKNEKSFNIKITEVDMIKDVIRPIDKQIQILEIEIGELKVEKSTAKTGKSRQYYEHIVDAITALELAKYSLNKALQDFQNKIQ
jgi:hypothetical protein